MPKADIGRNSKVTIFAPARRSPLEYCNSVRYEKN